MQRNADSITASARLRRPESSGLPGLDILPRIVRSPVDICLGTSSSQAAKSPWGMLVNQLQTSLILLSQRRPLHQGVPAGQRVSCNESASGRLSRKGAALHSRFSAIVILGQARFFFGERPMPRACHGRLVAQKAFRCSN
jgi:hypothetical protein